MTPDEIRARIAELEAENAAAPGWGAAVGARHEAINELKATLRRLEVTDKTPSGAEEITDFDRMIGSNMAENFFANPPDTVRELFAGWIAFTRTQLRASRPAPLPDGEVGELVERFRSAAPHLVLSGQRELYEKAADALAALSAERDALREALAAVVADILEYESVNNLAPNPGKQNCWQSVTRARALLRPEQDERSREAGGG